MDKDFIGILIIVVIVLLLILVIYTALRAFGIKADSSRERERMKLLASQNKKNKEEETSEDAKELINKITQPVSEVVSLVYRPKNAYLIERQLKTAGWSDYFTPTTWTAFTVLLGLLGLFLGFLFWGESKIFAAVFALVPIVAPAFLLNNSYNNRKEEILSGFPETIRIITGYLSGGLILTDAMKQTAKSASPIWKQFLEDFCERAEAESPKEALEWLQDECDIPEGKEFFATVRLTMELGGSVRDGFLRQAANIDELIEMEMQKKIEGRKMWATLVQAPIFLDIIAAVGLPVIGNMGDLFS